MTHLPEEPSSIESHEVALVNTITDQLQEQIGDTLVVEPPLTTTNADRSKSPDQKIRRINVVIKQQARTGLISCEKAEMRLLVTKANEVLSKEGIHGRIASVG